MSRYQSYINTAIQILETYTGEKPFGFFVKAFLGENKKYGGKDRKQITSLCYNYFRLGHAVKRGSTEEMILLGSFLCETTPFALMEYKKPDWNQQIGQPLDKKLAMVDTVLSFRSVFPFADELSKGIETDGFSVSFFVQPSLFLRIRPGAKENILEKLKKSDIQFTLLDNDCIVLPPATKADDLFKIDKEVVIQDYNSQRVLDHLQVRIKNISKKQEKVLFNAWDCCAASGGKSILLYDLLKGKVALTVSDIRPAILFNLQKRFNKAGIKAYKSLVADISEQFSETSLPEQDLIICDVPCSGSGTWSRTPEQLCFFEQKQIELFSNRQKKIVSNVIPFLIKGGLLVYITCSVFKKENEDVAHFIQEVFQLQLLHMEMLKGYDKKADSMFVAIFKK